MTWRTSAVLLGLVAALLVLRLVQNRQRDARTVGEQRLFQVDAEAVTRLEVDQLERGVSVGLERDAQGRWWMTEPVAYPAEPGSVRALLQLLSSARGIPVEPGEFDGLGFDPPRAILTFSAGDRVGRLEVGAEDVDLARCFVRDADGRVLRTGRRLIGALNLNPDDYRDRRATWMSARSVIGLRRTGALLPDEGGGERDLTLDAQLDPQRGWVSLSPVAATFDPVQLGFLVRGAAELRVDGFQADDVTDLARFGLDPPRLRLELEDQRGDKLALRLGCLEQGPVAVATPKRWFACREGFPFVWAVEHRAVGLLSAPREELYDTLLVRAVREDVVGVELGDVRLARQEQGWTVSAGSGEAYPADRDAVWDVLSALAFARVESFDEQAEFPAATGRLAVTLEDGRTLGGEVSGAMFRRLGDALVGRLSDEGDRLGPALEDLRSDELLRIRDIDVVELVLRQGEREAVFQRSPEQARWFPRGSDEEVAFEFYDVLERLLFLDAAAWTDRPAPSGEPLVVTLRRPQQGDVVLELLAIPQGALVVGRGARVGGDLFEDLRALLQ